MRSAGLFVLLIGCGPVELDPRALALEPVDAARDLGEDAPGAGCDQHGASGGSRRLTRLERRLVAPDGPGLSLSREVARHEVGGLSIVVIEGRAITEHHWFGCADRLAEPPIPTGRDTVYRVASLSKFVSAMALLHADARGLLPLDTDLRAWGGANPLLADWIDQALPRAPSAPVTIARLLGHAAGLDTHSTGAWPASDAPTRRQILLGTKGYDGDFAGGVELIHDPGTVFDYSGGGYTVAEVALESATGSTFEDFTAAELFEPSALESMTFARADTGIRGLANGCSRPGCATGVPITHAKAAGGLITGALDLAELVVALARDGVGASGRRALEVEELRAMLTPTAHVDSSGKACSTPGTEAIASDGHAAFVETCIDGRLTRPLDADGRWYGLGVDLSMTLASDGLPAGVSHSGSQDGASAYFEIDRRTGDGLIVLINGDREWVDGAGRAWGGSALLFEVVDAYAASR